MDAVETFIYDSDIRIKAVGLSESLEDLFEAQNISERDRLLFSKAALLAAAFASEEKDDDGSVFVSVKDPETRTAFTALCETDGRLRGTPDEYKENGFDETVLTVGRRLVSRGDYQSAVMGRNFEDAAREYFSSSRQTKAETAFPDGKTFVFAEYFPGHDVNYLTGAKKATPEYIESKLSDGMTAILSYLEDGKPSEKLKKVSETEIVFGCTCTKRKIKKALEATENLTLPVEVRCRFCGKTYTIEEM